MKIPKMILFVTAALAVSIGVFGLKNREQSTTPPPQATPEQDRSGAGIAEERKEGEYLSITYTSEDFTVESGRMMTFYT